MFSSRIRLAIVIAFAMLAIAPALSAQLLELGPSPLTAGQALSCLDAEDAAASKPARAPLHAVTEGPSDMAFLFGAANAACQFGASSTCGCPPPTRTTRIHRAAVILWPITHSASSVTWLALLASREPRPLWYRSTAPRRPRLGRTRGFRGGVVLTRRRLLAASTRRL